MRVTVASRLCKVILFIIIILCSFSRSPDEIQYNHVGGHSKEFDILTLVQSWPQISCFKLNHKNMDSKCSPCKIWDEFAWTLHGLWPFIRGGQSPFDCNPEMKYRKDSFDVTLRKRLEHEWPTYKSRAGNDAFWRHEWEKHGTCAAQLDSMNSQSKYFSKSLDLLKQYKIGQILRRGGIVSGFTYELKTVMSVIQES